MLITCRCHKCSSDADGLINSSATCGCGCAQAAECTDFKNIFPERAGTKSQRNEESLHAAKLDVTKCGTRKAQTIEPRLNRSLQVHPPGASAAHSDHTAPLARRLQETQVNPRCLRNSPASGTAVQIPNGVNAPQPISRGEEGIDRRDQATNLVHQILVRQRDHWPTHSQTTWARTSHTPVVASAGNS
eukprot:SAG11_NODE_266_length_11468_cov_11.519222_3_plen_188_part_00